MMTDLKYPMKSNTVPFWAVPMYAVLLPIVIFLVVYIRRRDVYDLHHAILGLLFSTLVTLVITEAIKDAVGRPRPDFFWRCFPDGKDVYDKWGNVICHGDKNVIKEGYKSFPSGHASGPFAGLGFLSLYLSGKIQVFDRKGHVAKLCIVFLPLLFASLVGISLVDDYWHHWQDIFAGGLLGLTVATFCYLHFFPPPYHPEDPPCVPLHQTRFCLVWVSTFRSDEVARLRLDSRSKLKLPIVASTSNLNRFSHGFRSFITSQHQCGASLSQALHN